MRAIATLILIMMAVLVILGFIIRGNIELNNVNRQLNKELDQCRSEQAACEADRANLIQDNQNKAQMINSLQMENDQLQIQNSQLSQENRELQLRLAAMNILEMISDWRVVGCGTLILVIFSLLLYRLTRKDELHADTNEVWVRMTRQQAAEFARNRRRA